MKKIFLTLAAAGLMLTGCTKTENGGNGIPDPDVIGFSTSTSRAPIYDLATLTDDGNGFQVFGAVANDDDTWYTNVDGTNNYATTSNVWGWKGTPAVWPTTDVSYPMNFYAIYPVIATFTTENAVSQLSHNVTIAATSADQVDMLAAKNSAAGKPASGQISLTFQHILSKVNFGVIAGHEMRAEVRSVAIRNVHSKSTFDYIAQEWDGTTTTVAGYDYYVVADDPIFTATGGTNEDRPEPFYSGTHSNNLMLMPQSSATGAPAAWDKTAATIATGAYIEVVYRIVDTAEETAGDYVGYTEGAQYLTDYPAFVPNNTGWEPTYTGGLGTGGGTEYNGALYVKVGFPVTLDWVPGKGYTYNICLGTANSSNGYYIDTTYYDDEGNITNIPIIGPDGQQVDKGDPVTDGIINFLIDVAPWVENSPATPLQ